MMTDDIDKWANSLSQIYSNFTKPILDIVLFSRKISETLGARGPLLIVVWYVFSAFMLKLVSPPIGKLTA
jgi:ATP-binding cassette subfamily D (ALD) protein 3